MNQDPKLNDLDAQTAASEAADRSSANDDEKKPDTKSDGYSKDAHWEQMEQYRLEQGPRSEGEPNLIVDVDGFEGPLDFLLMLARQQKLDLTKISILALAEQYLSFIEEARKLRLELAADYLVMAAWLAYLKSRLLLPDPEDEDEPSGEELAAMLAFRLKRLDAMREVSASLMERSQLGQDFFVRGAPEDMSLRKKVRFSANLYDLLTSYAAQRQRQAVSLVHVRKRDVWSLQEAREILQRLIGSVADWTPVDVLLSSYLRLDDIRATVLASSFAASLELVREGHLEVRQTEAFGQIMIRSAKK